MQILLCPVYFGQQSGSSDNATCLSSITLLVNSLTSFFHIFFFSMYIKMVPCCKGLSKFISTHNECQVARNTYDSLIWQYMCGHLPVTSLEGHYGAPISAFSKIASFLISIWMGVNEWL